MRPHPHRTRNATQSKWNLDVCANGSVHTAHKQHQRVCVKICARVLYGWGLETTWLAKARCCSKLQGLKNWLQFTTSVPQGKEESQFFSSWSEICVEPSKLKPNSMVPVSALRFALLEPTSSRHKKHFKVKTKAFYGVTSTPTTECGRCKWHWKIWRVICAPVQIGGSTVNPLTLETSSSSPAPAD